MRGCLGVSFLALISFMMTGWLAPDAVARQNGEVSPAVDEIVIPGPLSPFLRMAAISREAPHEEILALVARNVARMGYNHGPNGSKPTEFLVLLRDYVKMARELQRLAGSESVIRIAQCSEVTPLLEILGYVMKTPCGPSAQLDVADRGRAFLTLDSGFPLADLEQAIRKGNSFSHVFMNSRVPIVFAPGDWSTEGKDVLDSLLDDPALARLYWSIAALEHNTQTTLRRSPGLAKLLPLAAVLDFYGSQICIREGRVVVPGGAPAEPAWESLVGVDPGSPAQFVLRLLERDHGWLAAYFDALSRLPRSRQAYFTDPRHLKRFYEALKGKKVTPGATDTYFHPSPNLLLLTTSLQFDSDREPHVPGGMDVWKEIFRRNQNSRLERDLARRARNWRQPEQLIEAMFALTRSYEQSSLIRAFITLSEIDRRRSVQQRLNADTVRLLADKFSRFGSQYSIFADLPELGKESISHFLASAESIDGIGDSTLMADTLGIFQANLGLWEILARQKEIPDSSLEESFQAVIEPLGKIKSAGQLLDAARASLSALMRTSTGKTEFSQEDLIAVLAGPEQLSNDAEKERQALANRIRTVLQDQHLVSLDTVFELADGMTRMAEKRQASTESLIRRARELGRFEMPEPMLSNRERDKWSLWITNNTHAALQTRSRIAELLSQPSPTPEALTRARGWLSPILRDTLVGLNYAYYEPPGAQLLHNNALFVRSHDFLGESSGRREGGYWQSSSVTSNAFAALGGLYITGSLADLPYILARAEQGFIVPTNIQALIWEDLVPSLLISAIVPRWWQVTPIELHAVALFQLFGEELMTAAVENAALRQKVLEILSDRVFPKKVNQVGDALLRQQAAEAITRLTPADIFFLAAEFRQRHPEESVSWGASGKELGQLVEQFPEEASRERISRDFGAPHPAMALTYALEFLNVKPFPALQGYSSILLAESWESNNLFWARLADEKGYSPAALHRLIPQLTKRMIENIFGSHLDDAPAILRALLETGAEFRDGEIALEKGDPSVVPGDLAKMGKR